MQFVDDLIQKAKIAESENNWQGASSFYIKAAPEALKAGDHELSSELYMRAAVCLERIEEWRQIGLLWLHSAAALQGQNCPLGEGRYIDADAAKHNFPTISPSYWNSLSKGERIGRALRNSGYQLEKAGTNQSAYKQYEMSGAMFSNAKLWDEASRSYMLAAKSFINQHGELDIKLLEDFERSLNELKSQNMSLYLKRLILYYRHLRVGLTDQGNKDQADEIYIKECRSRTELFGLENRRLIKAVFQFWNVTSRYGTSFGRWLTISGIAAFLIFPPILFMISSSSHRITLGERIMDSFIQSINIFLGKGEMQLKSSLLLNLTFFAEQFCGYVMLGSLAAMIVSKITR